MVFVTMLKGTTDIFCEMYRSFVFCYICFTWHDMNWLFGIVISSKLEWQWCTLRSPSSVAVHTHLECGPIPQLSIRALKNILCRGVGRRIYKWPLGTNRAGLNWMWIQPSSLMFGIHFLKCYVNTIECFVLDWFPSVWGCDSRFGVGSLKRLKWALWRIGHWNPVCSNPVQWGSLNTSILGWEVWDAGRKSLSGSLGLSFGQVSRSASGCQCSASSWNPFFSFHQCNQKSHTMSNVPLFHWSDSSHHKALVSQQWKSTIFITSVTWWHMLLLHYCSLLCLLGSRRFLQSNHVWDCHFCPWYNNHKLYILCKVF